MVPKHMSDFESSSGQLLKSSETTPKEVTDLKSKRVTADKENNNSKVQKKKDSRNIV